VTQRASLPLTLQQPWAQEAEVNAAALIRRLQGIGHRWPHQQYKRSPLLLAVMLAAPWQSLAAAEAAAAAVAAAEAAGMPGRCWRTWRCPGVH